MTTTSWTKNIGTKTIGTKTIWTKNIGTKTIWTKNIGTIRPSLLKPLEVEHTTHSLSLIIVVENVFETEEITFLLLFILSSSLNNRNVTYFQKDK